ncbi:HD domain-containing protein [Desulfobulbus rhabdoformis]|uniref:HD-GYP domain-containing protein n=1 Tax=Desulfobulbus rhabdoformis TaxID=34032 RepID=UPI0019644BDE|nr:HD domain-containing protein [Desulfobulbus rhabdoformis]MBM9613499.1 HD domain-containing protein [Desulfobulbus rhabdoformis]
MNTTKGSLILKALSPDADEDQVIAYLEKRAKSIPPEEIPPLLQSLPVVLSRNVAEETGQLVIERLEELGAIAMFLPSEKIEGLPGETEAKCKENSNSDQKSGLQKKDNPMLAKFKQVNKELWIILSMLTVAWMLNYSVASQYLLLGFYTLPAVVSAYLFGRRQAVLTAFAAILMVGFVNYFNPDRFASAQVAGIGGDNQWYHIVSWGCILLVTAYTMGTLYEHNKNKVEELRQTYQGLLLILRHFIAQDEEKENHCFRVSVYATRIAATMGLKKDEIEDIRSAALLHDIGHLKVSRSLLRKATRIKRKDFAQVEEDYYPISGPMERILPLLIGQHAGENQVQNEKQGVQPVGASILAVADAYDMLTTGTGDMLPLPADQAKNKILEDQAKGFNPEVLQVFAKAVDSSELELPSMLL